MGYAPLPHACGLIRLGGVTSTRTTGAVLKCNCALGRGLYGLSGLRLLLRWLMPRASGVLCRRVVGWPARFGALQRCRLQMFASASAFNQNLAGWNTASVSNMSDVRSAPMAFARAD
jgi:surface protein